MVEPGQLEGPIVADRLFAWRDATGWSQSELSRRSGVSQYSITRIENAHTAHPRRGTVRKLARAFGVGLEEFLAGPDDSGGARGGTISADAPLTTRLQALAPEHQETLIRLTGNGPLEQGDVTRLGQLRYALFTELWIKEAEFSEWLLSATPEETAAILGIRDTSEEDSALRYVELLELFGGARDKVLRRIAEVTRPFAPEPT